MRPPARPPTPYVRSLGYAAFTTRVVPDPSTATVVEWMRKFTNAAKMDPQPVWSGPEGSGLSIRRLAEVITREVQSGDYASEALAVYDWVCRNVRYVRDIHDVEYVRWPKETLAARCGDCDDQAVVLASLMESIGATCSFVPAAFTPSGIPSHVFARVETPCGPMVLDPVANRETATMLGRITSFAVVPVGGGALRDGVLGVRFNGWGSYPWRNA